MNDLRQMPNFYVLLHKIQNTAFMQEKIVILDFGPQTTQLIGHAAYAELNIYSEIIPYNKYPFGREASKEAASSA